MEYKLVIRRGKCMCPGVKISGLYRAASNYTNEAALAVVLSEITHAWQNW